MKVAIIGYGMQGKSAAEYWRNLDHAVTVCDINAEIFIPDWASKSLGDDYLSNLSSYDLVVRSPSVRPDVLIGAGADESKVTTTTNEVMQVCPTQNIIGVTGTKGKGTCSSLIAEMLKNHGLKVHIGGNIGIDPLALLKENIKSDDWVVLELANFQTIDIKLSPRIAVCLMVMPEHLDWHKNIEEYFESKKQLFKHQKQDGLTVYNNLSDTSKDIAFTSQGAKVPYEVPIPPHNIAKDHSGAYVQQGAIYYKDTFICLTDDVAINGWHNLQNVCASIAAVWDITRGDVGSIVKAIKDFKGLEHRLELVDEIDGVDYYNDSFATTPEATIAAIRSFDRPKILIIGGSSKDISLRPVVDEILSSNIRHVIAIGETGHEVTNILRENNYPHITTGLTDMEDIVEIARDVAKKGDVVLLSTASASFGLFNDYKDRGNQFKQSVRSI